MIDETYNPDDPLFLASRGLDRDLSDEERRRLNEAMSDSPTLREEARRLEAVNAFVKQWGREVVEIDWKHHADLVVASMQSDAKDAKLRRVDRLLADWARRQPQFDENAFTDGVLAEISPRRRKAQPIQWVLRIGAPLAAAAAIALAVTATLWFNPTPVAVTVVLIGPTEVQPIGMASDQPRVVVSFGRSIEGSLDAVADGSGIGYMTMGSSPLPRTWEEPAPL